MAYTVLARKYRSWTFDELVGQEAVATTLKNAITSGRIHHGYLFTGTRGVGKTSAARILARSLNCLAADGPTITPCCKCESCTAIAEGEDVDVIEIDAASNTGVDNIRELRSNTVYRPARARYKIYIIDEVHMLSTGAFNALLKTLEEPPEHIKFIMATTEPQKVPATIQSRCLRFDFRSISPEKIGEHLQRILEQEKIEAEPAALRRVARLANGSMRDALSLLDQLLSLGSDRLTAEMIEDVLPTPHDEVLVQLIEQLASHDAAGALASLDQSLSGGYSLERFADTLAEQLRTLMLLNICGENTPLVDLPPAVAERMKGLCKQIEPEAYVNMITVLEELRRNVRFSSLGRPLMEAGIVRLASAVSYRSVQRLLDEIAGGTTPGSAPASAVAHSDARGSAVPPQSARPSTPMVSARPAASPIAPLRPTAPARSVAPAPVRPVSRPTESPRGKSSPPPPENMPRSASGPSPDDLKAAASDPMVRQALELFDGSLVNVERRPEKPS